MTEEETDRLNGAILATQMLLTEILAQFEPEVRSAIVDRTMKGIATAMPLMPAQAAVDEQLVLIRELAAKTVSQIAKSNS